MKLEHNVPGFPLYQRLSIDSDTNSQWVQITPQNMLRLFTDRANTAESNLRRLDEKMAEIAAIVSQEMQKADTVNVEVQKKTVRDVHMFLEQGESDNRRAILAARERCGSLRQLYDHIQSIRLQVVMSLQAEYSPTA